MSAAFGSFLGLVAGGIAGSALVSRSMGSREEKTGALVIATVLGTALGAFTGAALATPNANTTCTTVTSS